MFSNFKSRVTIEKDFSDQSKQSICGRSEAMVLSRGFSEKLIVQGDYQSPLFFEQTVRGKKVFYQDLFHLRKKGCAKKSIAQGTIEYLVVLAVVVVISLVVVGLFVNITSSPSQQILDSSDKLGEFATGGISVVEAVSDYDNNGFVVFRNYSGDGFYLKKVNVGDNVYFYDNVFVPSAEELILDIKDLCVCSGGETKKVCDFEFFYLSSSGLEDKESESITVECSSGVRTRGGGGGERSGGVIEPILELGTLENPWIINTCQELQDMNLHLDGNYILGGNINCYNDTHEGGVLYNGGLGFEPIGNNANRFTGSLNGQNHVIYSLQINRPLENEVGLFGHTSSTFVLKNLGLVSQNIIGNYELGSIAGINRGLIQNVYVTGAIRSNGTSQYFMQLGGLVGAHVSPGSIQNCYNTGSVIGFEGRHVGGLIGFNQLGTVSNSFTTGTVSGEAYIGGLIGNNYYGGIVTNSYATGDITGRYIVGGLIGYNHTPSSISNSYATGNAGNGSGMADIGGLIGSNDGSVLNSFSTGVSSGVEGRIGGLIGRNDMGSISNSYFDKAGTKTDSMCGSVGGTGCDDSKGIDTDIQTDYFYLFSNVPLSSWTFGEDGNWVARDNNYPILSWQN